MSDTAPLAPASAAATGVDHAPRQLNNPIEDRTRSELVGIAYRELAAGTWVGVVGVIAFAVLIKTGASARAMGGWLAFMAIPTAWQFGLAYRFNKLAPRPTEDRRWALFLVTATSLSALGWGATPWIFPALTEPGLARASHLLLLAGLVTASVRVLLPMNKGGMIFVWAIMGPLVLRYLVSGDTSLRVLAVFVILYIGHTIWTNRHNHRTLSDALVARFLREELATELRTENARRETRESELLHARESAEAASKAKGEFLAMISHEIRTPMNGVIGMLRVVRDTELTVAQHGYIKTASDSAEALLVLLNDVLDFSRIEANRLVLEHAPFPPVTAARAVANILHTRARDKGLELDLRLSEDIPAVILGDASRLRQILINLVGNAIKFTERGRVELKGECLNRNPHSATLQFTVSDTGIGIDSAAMAKLFKPFTQADNSLSRRYGGTGLGLAISLRLAEAMGGTLQVQSTVGQGATFRLTFPCQLPEVAPPTSSPAAPAPKFVAPKFNGRVLVVEDDSVNQQVIDLFLKKLNVTPKFAGDGEAAVAAATSEHFDLVLMDCQLPGIDGMEATRRIRAKLAGRPLRIVALTANANSHVRDACMAAGMDDFLTKPVRFELIAGVLQKHLPPG